MIILYNVLFCITVSTSIIFILLGVKWHFFQKKKELPEIVDLKGMTNNVILKITSPLPYLCLTFISIIFTVFCYWLTENGAKKDFILGLNLLQLLCWVLLLFVALVYIIVRNKRNKLNNHYLALCLEKKIDFHPGDINNHPRIFDKPWSKKDLKKVIFINPSTNEIFDKYVKRKDTLILFSLLIGPVILLVILNQIFFP